LQQSQALLDRDKMSADQAVVYVSEYPSMGPGIPNKHAMARYIVAASRCAEEQKGRVRPPGGHRVRTYIGMIGGSVETWRVKSIFEMYRDWFAEMTPEQRQFFKVTGVAKKPATVHKHACRPRVRTGDFYRAACAMRAAVTKASVIGRRAKIDAGVSVSGGGGAVAAVAGMIAAGNVKATPFVRANAMPRKWRYASRFSGIVKRVDVRRVRAPSAAGSQACVLPWVLQCLLGGLLL